MPLDPDETADQRARRRELEAAGQLGLPEDALGLDEDEELLDAEPQAGAVTTEGRKPWRPSRPKPPKPTQPLPPTEPPAAVGPVVLVKSASDLKKLKNGTTYRWSPGFTLKAQLVLKGLKNITLEQPRIDGADESCIYVVNTQNLTIRGGSLTNSRRKSGLLTDGNTDGIVMIGVTCTGNSEHGVYLGTGSNDSFEIRDCILSSNDRCGLQLNAELGGDRTFRGGKIIGCTIRGNAKGQGAAMNLGSWQEGLLENCTIEGNQKGIVLWKGDGAQACKNVMIRGCRFKGNGSGDPIRFDGGSTGRLESNTVDRKPKAGGWTSNGKNQAPSGEF